MPRETGRRRRNADDDESSSEDEQTTTTTTTTTAQEPSAVAPPPSAPAAPARARAKAPAAAPVKPPTMPAAHADPTPAAAKKAAESGSDDDDDDSSSDDSSSSSDESDAPAATTAMSAAHSALAAQMESINYDTLTYAALLSLMKQATRPVIEEMMAQREQQVESTIQQQQNQRVERFLDAADGQAGASNSNDEEAADGYRYNAMLTRLFEALNRNNEGSAMTERNQLPVPILERMGKKKTVIANFGRICDAFHRPMEDVKDFIEKELSIRGNLDSNNALILKFEIRKQTDFDRVLIKYLDEYVKCNSCHRIDTTLTKDGRRLELRCNVCTATRTVTAAGTATFSAQIEKRSRQRAAMTL